MSKSLCASLREADCKKLADKYQLCQYSKGKCRPVAMKGAGRKTAAVLLADEYNRDHPGKYLTTLGQLEDFLAERKFLHDIEQAKLHGQDIPWMQLLQYEAKYKRHGREDASRAEMAREVAERQADIRKREKYENREETVAQMLKRLSLHRPRPSTTFVDPDLVQPVRSYIDPSLLR